MKESNVLPEPASDLDEAPSGPQQNESPSRVPLVTEASHKRIRRNQNKNVAEKTGDMFMSGLMCE